MSVKSSLLLILLTAWSTSYAQTDFEPNKKIYVKGQSALIGNNILSKHPKKPIHDNFINDFHDLKFIDVDDDSNTFSSSQATLTIPEKDAEIEYAALYWSAIYKYDQGRKVKISIKKDGTRYQKEIYKGNDTRAMNVNSILFKTPNSSYKPIKGQIIFDDFNNEESYPETKPYVCYAEVTDILKNSATLNGSYTVANMKATEGFVTGGASGGWLLYVVYKTEKASPKYFTTYNGFIDVHRAPVNIVFDDFKTPEEGVIETSLLIGALEGDQKFKTDVCAFFNYQTKTYTRLSNSIRPKLNFFNSTISINNSLFTDRNPNSKNTFGFDALKLKIPNKNNSTISHNATEAAIQLNSKADRFFLFFVGFETEITPIYMAVKKDKNGILILNKTKAEIVDENLEKIKNLKSITIPSIEKGYYLVSNIFSKQANASNWVALLKEKGHTPKTFVNPKNGWTYVYLETNLDPKLIYEKQKALLKHNDFEDIWVLKINL